MKFKVNKIAAAVAVGLGTAVAGMSAAQADEVLFPYVVASGTVTTLVSAINMYESGFQGPEAAQLHYHYYYKNGSNATNNAAACAEVDERLPSSPNDIVTFDVSQHFGANNLGILFENAAAATKVDYGTKSFSLLDITLPVRAFLVVDNNDFYTGAGLFNSIESVAGEAVILEFKTGAAWGYAAYNAAGVYNNGGLHLNPYDFSDAVETAGEVIADSYVPVALAPFVATSGEWETRFFVTPISPTRRDDTGKVVDYGMQLQRNLNAAVRLSVQNPRSAVRDVMFDRDELPVSGQAPQNVVCVGGVSATEMLTEGALNRVPKGGWSNLVVSRGTIPSGVVQTNEAVVIKLEYNPNAALAVDDDSTTPTATGVVNNSVWLRKGIRESVARPLEVFAAGADINSPSSDF